jgi:hypothetical protein
LEYILSSISDVEVIGDVPKLAVTFAEKLFVLGLLNGEVTVEFIYWRKPPEAVGPISSTGYDMVLLFILM